MRLTFLGVRGSTPAPGAGFVHVGGNTSCIAVAHDDAVPTLVLDAGTGLRRLGQLLGSAPFCGSILLSHLHWDHVQGLPFCPTVDRPDARVALWLPEQGDTEAVLARGLSPPHFPIGPEGLRGRWHFHGMDAGGHVIENFEVLALDIPHKGGRTFGYRVSDGPRSFAYLPDHATSAPSGPGAKLDQRMALTLAQGVDVLIHDAQFDEHERPLAADYGHATVADAVALAVAAQARTLVLFHHAPDRTDDEVAALAERHRRPGLDMVVATEDLVLTLSPDADAAVATSAPLS